MVNEQHPDWTLHIYGEGELEKDVQEIINKKRNHVYLHKPSSAIWDIYKRYSIFVLTSVFEPFGLVLPEAMSCGLSVVAFDCPYGPADIITDGKDGFLIKGRNNIEFANRICSLIENDQLRVRLGKAGIQSSKRYDQGLIMPQWKKLFEQLTGLNL
jgi:glycosyltransferase involved in cell wall biosynthesis